MSRVWLLVCVVLLSACQPRYADFFPCRDNGTPKPKLAVFPMKNHLPSTLPWKISEELDVGLRDMARVNGNLYFVPEDNVKTVMGQIGDEDLLIQNVATFRRFRGCDFIVLTELVQHSEQPLRQGQPLPAYVGPYTVDEGEAALLDMKVLVKVIDIRTSQPTLVLEEVVECQHVVPSGPQTENYHRKPWGSKGYESSSLRQAHQRLVHDIAVRLENVTHAVSA